MNDQTEVNETSYAEGQSHLNDGLGGLDPRIGDGKIIAGRLWEVYQRAFDDFAGPKQYRHSCNYDTYHRAALLAVYMYTKDSPNE
jgi:hypothetical protein